MTVRILEGHVLGVLRGLPAESVHCVVTSPPYYGLRDYGIEPQVWGGEDWCGKNPGGHVWGSLDERMLEQGNKRKPSDKERPNNKAAPVVVAIAGAFCRRCGAWRGSLGLEPTLGLYLDHMVAVCREIQRVLRRDGTFWLNIGDSYATHRNDHDWLGGRGGMTIRGNKGIGGGLKPKDLLLVPARLALRLQDDGWWVRSEVVWAKRAPMPESATDRPTCAHEKVFLLTKSKTYFYDADAVKEVAESDHPSVNGYKRRPRLSYADADGPRGNDEQWTGVGGKRNLRNVWWLPPSPFPDAHFATFPPELPRRAILAGTSAKGVCPACGAPWVRVVDTAHPGDHGRRVRTYEDHGVLNRRIHPGDHCPSKHETLGWRPTCGCASESKLQTDPIPATVLDPFLGSGTTALVADRLGRDCIGIELSPKYAEMARRRLREDAGMFADLAAE